MSNDKLLRLREFVSGVASATALSSGKRSWVTAPEDVIDEIDKLLAEPDPESEPAPTDPERAIIGWVSDNCGLTVAQEAELARRLESLRAAVPTDAEVDAVISEFGIAALVVGARNSLENQGEALRTRDALRALIARRVAAATDLRKRLTEREDQVDDLQQSIDNITLLARLRGGGA